MATWQEFERQAPELAKAVRHRFDRDKHKLLATVRKDGAPRITGIETVFEDGQLRVGSMADSWKSRDLKRDPRFALHSTSSDQTMTDGDARISGTMALHSSSDDADTFTADITEAVTITVEGNELVIVSWHEGKGVSRAVRT
ncbi:pyridoxamine 5'-phosphate oxidase family protein [Lentzea tibetensis]|uniref:Pyridoxamine 5'-phosphate oxidase family protein n=1 Tax=Lentzea tibetensis TaxID=2591470 RepID=A0A563EZH7_9PSEU|nr:pyridoxamine 5'-phosphate oxidase family protein [Lentzea tibetensis]TWP52928.1 pyridoxamine 5'-phosphate oxidase family protein [Lentzea tibetensis]